MGLVCAPGIVPPEDLDGLVKESQTIYRASPLTSEALPGFDILK